MGRVRVCRMDELSETTARRFEHDGHVVVVSLAASEPRALRDQCPHRGIALSGGIVRNGILTCPGHFWRFDLRDGHCIGRPWEVVPGFDCRVVDGWVEIDLPPPQAKRSMRELLLAHARDPHWQHRDT
ncbi:MAG: nitrite reductase small subunit [Pseudonocardiales bacterium]|nr:nitrite reductase small subunit [Pseudonocardiales bacterium]MDT4973262.1 nitrite reductase small subunit [Pseudonocardiales bacterium]